MQGYLTAREGSVGSMQLGAQARSKAASALAPLPRRAGSCGMHGQSPDKPRLQRLDDQRMDHPDSSLPMQFALLFWVSMPAVWHLVVRGLRHAASGRAAGALVGRGSARGGRVCVARRGRGEFLREPVAVLVARAAAFAHIRAAIVLLGALSVLFLGTACSRGKRDEAGDALREARRLAEQGRFEEAL